MSNINFINTGSSANKGDGDTLRTAFNKINSNFRYLSTFTGASFNGVGESIIPLTSSTYDLGSLFSPWGFVYTYYGIRIAGNTISINTAGNIEVNGSEIKVDTSNLDFTSLRSSLVPDNTYDGDLGSSSNPWRTLYVNSGSSIYIGTSVLGVSEENKLLLNGSPLTTATTINIGTVTTGTDVSVTNTGTEYDVWLNFVVPQGPQGPQGDNAPITNFEEFPYNLVPIEDQVYNLGNSTSTWQNLYLGGGVLTISTSGELTVNGTPVVGGSVGSTSTLINGATIASLQIDGSLSMIGGSLGYIADPGGPLFGANVSQLNSFTIKTQGPDYEISGPTPEPIVVPGPIYSWYFSSTGTFTTPGSIIPNQDVAYDLGSPNRQWRSLYVSTGTIYIGGIPLTVNTESNTLVVGTSTSTSTVTLATEEYVQQAVAQGGGGNANTGNITFDNEIISAPNGANILMQAKNSGGNVNSLLELNSEFAVAKLTAKSEGNYTFYSGSDFTLATWEPYEEFGQQRSRLTFVGATSLHDFISNNLEFGKSGDNENGEWTVDGINFYPWPYSTGWAEETGTLTVEFYDAQVIPPPESTVTVETFALRWVNESKVAVDLEDYSQLDIVGVGVDVKVESTRSINVEAGDGVNVLAANNLNLESVNGTVKIAAAIYSNNSQWTFSPLLTGEGTVPAKITFPDNTFQTTAWAGGRVVPAPGSSLGASGDKAEDIAFNSDYFYYCIADYTDGSSTIWKRVAWSIDDNW